MSTPENPLGERRSRHREPGPRTFSLPSWISSASSTVPMTSVPSASVLPGLVTRDGVVDRCPNIPGWDKPVAVAKTLAKALDRPVVVANDVNCGAVAEHRVGAGRGVDDLMAMFVGTGVGGGIILDGRLIEGSRGMAGEVGHITVIDDGRVCGCGERGHLEAYAGRAGIETRGAPPRRARPKEQSRRVGR